MPDDNSTILYQVDNAFARITLNRPEKRNALNDELIAALCDALRRANSDKDVSVIILSGAGSDFCSGADLEALQKISNASVAENLEDARSLMELFILIRSLDRPVIAAVKGRALAGGCGLATACDIVLAGRTSRFGYPEVKIGFVPAMVMAILRRNVSEKRAFELIALGAEFSADEAAAFGLVNHVLDDEAFDDEVDAFALQFLRVSRSGLALAKHLLYQTDALSFEDALRFGVDTNVIARMTEECQKGIERFLKK
jgi:methylglutaconyl-CoA hydratase